MNTCEICFNDTDVLYERTNQMLCNNCRGWIDYWVSLTPAEQQEELRQMDLHAGYFHESV